MRRSSLLLPLLLPLCCVVAHAAPAPFWPREERFRSDPPERCVMRWTHASYDAEFLPGGAYSARLGRQGTAYEGSWSLRGRVLLIHERVVGGSGNDWRTYRVELSGRWAGEILPSGGEFRLTPSP